jgi:hypothetical protein
MFKSGRREWFISFTTLDLTFSDPAIVQYFGRLVFPG